MVGSKPHLIFHICEKWDSKRMFMIEFDCDECNIINLMIVVKMLEMNYLINGLIIWQMCLKTYMLRDIWTRLNHQRKHFKNLNIMYNNLNTNEFGCTLYGIANCLLSDYTTTSNGIYIFLYLTWCTNKCKICVFQSPTYMKALLSKHPFYIQFLKNLLDYIYKKQN